MEMKKCKNSNDCKIMLSDIHSEYLLPAHPKIRQRQMWDGFNAECVINDALAILFPNEQRKINENDLSIKES